MHSESITALILCAGTGERWGDFTGSPKQLAPINNESLLQRTVRLLKSRKIDSIHIISHDERLRLEGCHFFRPENSRWTAETLSSTRELWTERTLILLGDVFFSEKAMDCITGFEGPVAFFGRSGPNRFTGHRCSELFAISFSGNRHESILFHCQKAIEAAIEGQKGRLWQVYRSMTGIPLNLKYIEKELFHHLDQFTDDFDYPFQYQRALPRYERWLTTHGWRQKLFLATIILRPDFSYWYNLLTHYRRMVRWRFRLWQLGWKGSCAGTTDVSTVSRGAPCAMKPRPKTPSRRPM